MKKTLVETDAFLLRKVNFRDADLIVTFLTKESGIMTGIARSAKKSKKRFVGGLEPLHVLVLSYNPSQTERLATILGSSIKHEFVGIATSYDKLLFCGYYSELIKNLSEGAGEPAELYELLFQTFQTISQAEDEVDLFNEITCRFELTLLRLLGFLPILSHCHLCFNPLQEKEKVTIIQPDIRIVCSGCRAEGFNLLTQGTTLITLESIPQRPLSHALGIPKLSVVIGRKITNSIIKEVIGKPPRV